MTFQYADDAHDAAVSGQNMPRLEAMTVGLLLSRA